MVKKRVITALWFALPLVFAVWFDKPLPWFTVVVAILGVLAAVIVPNVAKFIGEGTVESANTEAHNVQTAVTAYMADNTINDISTYGTTVGSDGSLTGDLNAEAGQFLLNPAGLQALYTVNSDGAITAAMNIMTHTAISVFNRSMDKLSVFNFILYISQVDRLPIFTTMTHIT